MYIGFSLFLLAVGAILAFAVTTGAEGFDINSAGWILMIVGAAGVVISLVYDGIWARRSAPREVVVERDAPPR